MLDNETAFWVFSTNAQALAALIGLIFIGIRGYIAEWRKIFENSALEMRKNGTEGDILEMMINIAGIVDQVRNNVKRFSILLQAGIIVIVLNVIAIIFDNSSLYVIVLSSSFGLYILLVIKLRAFLLGWMPTGVEYLEMIPVANNRITELAIRRYNKGD